MTFASSFTVLLGCFSVLLWSVVALDTDGVDTSLSMTDSCAWADDGTPPPWGACKGPEDRIGAKRRQYKITNHGCPLHQVPYQVNSMVDWQCGECDPTLPLDQLYSASLCYRDEYCPAGVCMALPGSLGSLRQQKGLVPIDWYAVWERLEPVHGFLWFLFGINLLTLVLALAFLLFVSGLFDTKRSGDKQSL